jgi:hypothetical protein
MTPQDIKALSQQLSNGRRPRRFNALTETLARGRILDHLLEAGFPDPAAVSSTALKTASEGSTARSLASQMARIALRIMASSDQFSISEAVERAIGYVCGPPLAEWEYICVNVTIADAPPADIGGWQLASFDYATDPHLPLTGAPGVAGDLLAPRVLHEMHGFGLLRRPVGSSPVAVDDDQSRVLVWPLLALNLALEIPVVAGPRYVVEPGRRVVRPHAGWPLPSEVSRWGYLLPPYCQQPSYVIGREDEAEVSAFCRAFLACAASLDARRRDQLARAADHFLFVKCHALSDPRSTTAASPLHLSEAAFRLTAAMECLLAGGDGGHTEVSRKVQQRAAVLVGTADEDRLQVRNTVGVGYAARSAYAHGAKDKQSDLQALQAVVCRVLTNWVVQAAYSAQLSGRHGGREGLVSLLDDALLSDGLYQEHIIAPRDVFRAKGGTPPLPAVTLWDGTRFRLAGPGVSPVDLA